MSFGEGLKNICPHELHEVCDFSAPRCVLVVEGVKNDTTVYVYVSAERVVLERIARIHNRRVDVLLLLLSLLFKKCLVILEVFQGPFDSEVDLVLQKLNHPAVKSESFSPPLIPLHKYFVVRFLLLETHLYQHPHLLSLQIELRRSPSTGSKGLVDAGLRRLL